MKLKCDGAWITSPVIAPDNPNHSFDDPKVPRKILKYSMSLIGRGQATDWECMYTPEGSL